MYSIYGFSWPLLLLPLVFIRGACQNSLLTGPCHAHQNTFWRALIKAADYRLSRLVAYL